MTKIMRIPSSVNVNPADFTRTLRRVVVPVKFSINDVLIPAAWADLFAKINNGDELIVCREDGAWRLHLLVTSVGVGLVQTAVLHRWESDDVKAESEPDSELDVPDNYVVNHAPRTGWRVLMKEPHLEVSRNHKSKSEAVRAAVAHAMRATGVAA